MGGILRGLCGAGLCWLLVAQARTPVAVGSAMTALVTIPDNAVRFRPPQGFTVLPAAESAVKYPNGMSPPAHVVGKVDRTVTIACELKPLPLPPDELTLAAEWIGRGMERMVPGPPWVRRETIREEFALLEPALRASIESIRIE